MTPDPEAAERGETKQFGCVLIFATHVSRRRAEAALRSLRPLLDRCNWAAETQAPPVHEFDREEEGLPVWYIP